MTTQSGAGVRARTPRGRAPMGSLIIAVMLGVAMPQPAFAGNAVTRWVEAALNAVRIQSTTPPVTVPPTTTIGTPDAGRLYAMVTVAMYDAVNGIDRARQQGREQALVSPAGAPRNGNRDVAAAAAAHTVLRALLRANRPPMSDGTLDAALAAELEAAGGADAPPVTAARAWGEHVGRQVIAIRSTDGTQAAQPMAACGTAANPVCDPGEYHTGFDARWKNMAPFGAASLAPYASAPPPAITSAAYAAAWHDVRTCGSNSAALDSLCQDATSPSERLEIANFWLAEAGTVRETGTWLQAALAIAHGRGTVDSIADTARLFALVGMGIADAVTLTWDTKAAFFSWRPQFAIRRANEDGNPDTTQDAGWTARFGVVGGSPEYNSGTSAFAGAASAVIEGFYCHAPVSFSFETDLATNGPRSYPTPLAAAEEAGRSRIFQGIHFQFSNEDGRRAGRAIGTEIVTTRLRRVNGTASQGACP